MLRAQQPGLLVQVDRVGVLLVAPPVQIPAFGATTRVAHRARLELPRCALGLRGRGPVRQDAARQSGARSGADGRVLIAAGHELESVAGHEIAAQLLGERPREVGIGVDDRERHVRDACPDVALGVARAQVG